LKIDVSVVIPTYNRPEELIRSLKTVFNQTYDGNIEVLIIDDSKKSQEKFIDEKFHKILKNSKNRYIKYIYKGKKEGSPRARNIGIKEARGEFIAFLDDDDEWLPDKIKKQVKVMKKFKDVGLVICYSIDKRFGRERISKPSETITHDTILKSFNLSSSSTYLVRKNAIEKTDGFDVTLPSAQEYDLAIRLSQNYKVRCVPKVLMIQNMTEGQISENWNRKIKGLLAIYHKHGKEYSSISFIDYIINNIKFIGVLGLFFLGYIFGNRIYYIIIPAKKIYET